MFVTNGFMRKAAGLLLLTASALAGACGSDDDNGGGEQPSDAGSGGGPLDAGNQTGMDARVPVPRPDAGRRPDAGDGAIAMAEVCDGIDNDGDGQIDNIDVAKDGICDCLLLATLGVPGTHGIGDVFGAWLNARSDTGAADLGSMTLTPALLSKYQVIIAEDLSKLGRELAVAEVDALEAWVRGGGGLMTLIGYSISLERTNANLVLARFGMSYGAQGILAKQGTQTVPVTMWSGPHPVIDGVTRIGVDNGYPVEGTGTTLAQEGGFTMLKVQEVGTGHVIVWGDEWITYNTEWSEHADYQVERLWLNAIKWLTNVRECQVPVPIYI